VQAILVAAVWYSRSGWEVPGVLQNWPGPGGGVGLQIRQSLLVENLIIRPAVPADMDVLRMLFRRSSLSNDRDRAALLASPDALELPDLSIEEGRTRVATAGDGRILGFASTITSGDITELDDLFVDPDWMRRGIGIQLVLDVVEIARQTGVRRVEVTANPHALGFYETAGFVFDHDVETRFGSAPRMFRQVIP